MFKEDFLGKHRINLINRGISCARDEILTEKIPSDMHENERIAMFSRNAEERHALLVIIAWQKTQNRCKMHMDPKLNKWVNKIKIKYINLKKMLDRWCTLYCGIYRVVYIYTKQRLNQWVNKIKIKYINNKKRWIDTLYCGRECLLELISQMENRNMKPPERKLNWKLYLDT